MLSLHPLSMQARPYRLRVMVGVRVRVRVRVRVSFRVKLGV